MSCLFIIILARALWFLVSSGRKWFAEEREVARRLQRRLLGVTLHRAPPSNTALPANRRRPDPQHRQIPERRPPVR